MGTSAGAEDRGCEGGRVGCGWCGADNGMLNMLPDCFAGSAAGAVGRFEKMLVEKMEDGLSAAGAGWGVGKVDGAVSELVWGGMNVGAKGFKEGRAFSGEVGFAT